MMAVPGVGRHGRVQHLDREHVRRTWPPIIRRRQLMDMNRDKLARLGVDRAAADSLFANLYYTPVDATAITEALTSARRRREHRRDRRARRRRRQPRDRLFHPPPDRADGRMAGPPRDDHLVRRRRRASGFPSCPDVGRHRRRLSDRQPVMDAGDGRRSSRPMTSAAAGKQDARSSPGPRRRWRRRSFRRAAGRSRSGRSCEARRSRSSHMECEPVNGTKGMIAPP